MGAVFVVLVAGVVASTSEAIRAGRAERTALEQRDRASTAELAANRERIVATQDRDKSLSAEKAANTERNRANQEAATAQAVNDFLQNDLLAQASVNSQGGQRRTRIPDLRVRTALDRAAERIKGQFRAQPEVEASIRLTIGNAYRDLGLYPQAEQQDETGPGIPTADSGQE